MNSHQIECFFNVVKHMNFSRAADEMYASQPSVSKQIKKLEGEFGVPIFDRTKKKLELTPYGQKLYILLKETSESYDALREEAIHAAEMQKYTLSIAFPQASTLMTDFMKRVEGNQDFNEKYRYEVSFGGIGELYNSLLNNTVDLIISMDDLLPENRLISTVPIDYVIKAIIYRRDLFPLNRQPESVEDFENFPFLVTREVENPDETGGRYRQDARFPYEPKHKIVPNIESMIWHVMTGDGVAIIDRSINYFREMDVEIGSLQLPYGHSIVLAWRHDLAKPAVEEFVRLYMKCLDDEKDR